MAAPVTPTLAKPSASGSAAAASELVLLAAYGERHDRDRGVAGLPAGGRRRGVRYLGVRQPRRDRVNAFDLAADVRRVGALTLRQQNSEVLALRALEALEVAVDDL